MREFIEFLTPTKILPEQKIFFDLGSDLKKENS